MTVPRLTRDQAVIVSGYTGFLACSFSDLHAEVERRLGRPVWTHEFASPDMRERLQSMFRTNFLEICAEGTQMPEPDRENE